MVLNSFDGNLVVVLNRFNKTKNYAPADLMYCTIYVVVLLEAEQRDSLTFSLPRDYFQASQSLDFQRLFWLVMIAVSVR